MRYRHSGEPDHCAMTAENCDGAAFACGTWYSFEADGWWPQFKGKYQERLLGLTMGIVLTDDHGRRYIEDASPALNGNASGKVQAIFFSVTVVVFGPRP